MSTRCTTHFRDNGADVAIIYRHGDGYPDGHGADLLTFLRECSELRDPRFNDPSYLAAKLVVWLARMFGADQAPYLDFLSVGVMMDDPGDIEYMYTVDCSPEEIGASGSGKWPVVRCFEAGTDRMSDVPIPGNFTLKASPVVRRVRRNCGDYVANPRLGSEPTYHCDMCGYEVPESRMHGGLFDQPIISTSEPMYRDYVAGLGHGPYLRVMLKKIAKEYPGNYCQSCFRKLNQRLRV